MDRKLLIVDDCEDLRDLLQAWVLLEFGMDCLALGGLMELQSYGTESLTCQAALVDINLGASKPNGVDVFHWLRAQGYVGKIYFFTGHAKSNPEVSYACQLGAQVFEKPLKPDRLRSLMAEALQTPEVEMYAR